MVLLPCHMVCSLCAGDLDVFRRSDAVFWVTFCCIMFLVPLFFVRWPREVNVLFLSLCHADVDGCSAAPCLLSGFRFFCFSAFFFFPAMAAESHMTQTVQSQVLSPVDVAATTSFLLVVVCSW